MERTKLEKVLSSYQHIGNQIYNQASTTSADDLHATLRYFLIDMPVVPILLACHSLFAALSIYSLTRGRQFWLKSLVLTAFAAFGGSTLANLLSGSPAPLFTVSSNYMMAYIFAAWYIVNHSVVVRYIFSFRVTRALLAFGATAAKARSIMSFIDAFVPRFPTAPAGAVVLGGLAGSGGALFVTVEKMVQAGLHTPSEFSSPGWAFKSAYVAALVYYVGTDPVGWVAEKLSIHIGKVDREEMRFAVSLMLCTHAMLETLYGQHVNPLWAVERLLYALTGIRREIEQEGEMNFESSKVSVESSRGGEEKEEKKEFGAEGLRRRKLRMD